MRLVPTPANTCVIPIHQFVPDYGSIYFPGVGTGGSHWTAEASLGIDLWVTAPPTATPANQAVAAIYEQYADATGHAPPLREDAMIFWYEHKQSPSQLGHQAHIADMIIALCVFFQAKSQPLQVFRDRPVRRPTLRCKIDHKQSRSSTIALSCLRSIACADRTSSYQ